MKTGEMSQQKEERERKRERGERKVATRQTINTAAGQNMLRVLG